MVILNNHLSYESKPVFTAGQHLPLGALNVHLQEVYGFSEVIRQGLHLNCDAIRADAKGAAGAVVGEESSCARPCPQTSIDEPHIRQLTERHVLLQNAEGLRIGFKA